MDIIQSRYRKILYLDWFVFVVLLGFLIFIVFTSSSTNIRTDSIDYYAILQRVVDRNAKPIISNLHFVEQRSPGYPLLSTIPYYLTTLFLEPFVETEQIVLPLSGLPLSGTRTTAPPPPGGTEHMSLPMQPLLFRDVFFKNFYIEPEKSWFEWKIISSLLFASYFLLFIGITFIVKTLLLEYKVPGVALIMLAVFTSTVFMQNIVNSPAYATLTAVGISSLFCWAFVKSFLKPTPLSQFLSGLFLGLLVLTRLETIVIFGTVFLYLALSRDKIFLRNFVIGAVIPFGILLAYNYFLFGTVFHLGILRGDINQISFDWSYIVANILNPQSGVIFWSPLIMVGIIGLFLSNKNYLRVLGISSIILIGLVLVRIPIMYNCIGENPVDIGGLLISCPKDMGDALLLIRSDMNRYVTVLFPFSVLGLRVLVSGVFRLPVRLNPIVRAT